MVKVWIKASVDVTGGPTLPVGAALEHESYAFASVSLDAKDGAADEQDLALLPEDGDVALLALNARTAAGEPAAVTVTPMNGTDTGAASAVTGALLVANAGILAAWVAGGPRALTVANETDAPVTVDVLTVLDA